jgi:hypothetical protein
VTDLRARIDEVDARLNAAASLLAQGLLGDVDHEIVEATALRLVERARGEIEALWAEAALTGWP